MDARPAAHAANGDDAAALAQVTACLDHLTGPARGTTTWLGGSAIDIRLGDDRRIRSAPTPGSAPPPDTVARLHRAAASYEIQALGDLTIWVNGRRIDAQVLAPRDLIEFGDAGPLSRFRLLDDRSRPARPLAELLGDCWDYLHVSRKPWFVRMGCALRDLIRNVTARTTPLFRTFVVVAIVGLGWSSYSQWQSNKALEQQIQTGLLRLDSFSSALGRASEEALRASDLNALRQELASRLTVASDRLAVLEQRSEASARVIAASRASVAFLQGGYAFKETSSGRMLRYAVDGDGRVLVTPLGQPGLTLEGAGPVAERQFTGTAFALADRPAMVTNRHVAVPWEADASVEALAGQGMEPVRTRFVAYLPGVAESLSLDVIGVSDEADLALLRYASPGRPVAGLSLAAELPRPGEEVIVMGYPTGLRSMLAQTGDAFIEALQSGGDLDFWAVAARLAKDGLIRPLASQGIVGQVTRATLVYDAETTSGGSGGPVLDARGKVVAVNAAILPEYGGSNLGVPVARVQRMLASFPGS